MPPRGGGGAAAAGAAVAPVPEGFKPSRILFASALINFYGFWCKYCNSYIIQKVNLQFPKDTGQVRFFASAL